MRLAGVSAGFRQFPPVLDIARKSCVFGLSGGFRPSRPFRRSLLEAPTARLSGCRTSGDVAHFALAIFSSVTGVMGRSQEEGIADQESTSLSNSQQQFSGTQKKDAAAARHDTSSCTVTPNLAGIPPTRVQVIPL
jgi:hypothetical protein